LEQDIAITNISLDLLGQSRNFYQYAALLMNKEHPANEPAVTEDSLAYLRKEREYKNLLLVEQPNGDWGQTILRQFLYSQFQYLLFIKLQDSADEQLSAIAAKGIKETTYHVRWSSEWVIRLGDGTEESHERITKAIDALWRYTGEMFIPAEYEKLVDVASLRDTWYQKVSAVFTEATLETPAPTTEKGAVFMQTGGKHGQHTEELGFILTDLQYMQRAYPGAQW
jgi:ring-1,2-phenylacetyl-CoA epoxidase subunit PaaC